MILQMQRGPISTSWGIRWGLDKAHSPANVAETGHPRWLCFHVWRPSWGGWSHLSGQTTYILPLGSRRMQGFMGRGGVAQKFLVDSIDQNELQDKIPEEESGPYLLWGGVTCGSRGGWWEALLGAIFEHRCFCVGVQAKDSLLEQTLVRLREVSPCFSWSSALANKNCNFQHKWLPLPHALRNLNKY